MKLFAPLLVLLAASAGAQEAPALKHLQTIPLPGVKGRFDHFAIDTKGQRLFVAALGNNTLEIIDLAAGKRLKSIVGMSKPTGVLYLAEVLSGWIDWWALVGHLAVPPLRPNSASLTFGPT